MASYPEANEAASADVAIALTEAQYLSQQSVEQHGLPHEHQHEHDHGQQHKQDQLEQEHEYAHGNENQHQPLTHNQHQHHHEPSATPPPPPHNHELTLNQVHNTDPHHQPTETHAELYDGSLISPVPVTAVAHHGLQVLQAASAAPISPTSNDLAQQYAQSAALQMGEPTFSSPLPNHTLGPPMNGAHASQKVTRLRRACDMCSQRKVKVRSSVYLTSVCVPLSSID
jgi:hypothetical protein